ncbi:MAG: hypothetical protein KJO64_07950 [Bacteroidia bacterium]|nr:hypothetical protein [Bacteroidia bacterium]
MNADDTNLFSNNPETSGLPHSEQDAACHSLTRTEIKSSFTKEELIDLFGCLLQGLSHNVLSGDVWTLSLAAAKSHAIDNGIDLEKINTFLNIINRARKQEGNKNPMSCLF